MKNLYEHGIRTCMRTCMKKWRMAVYGHLRRMSSERIGNDILIFKEKWKDTNTMPERSSSRSKKRVDSAKAILLTEKCFRKSIATLSDLFEDKTKNNKNGIFRRKVV